MSFLHFFQKCQIESVKYFLSSCNNKENGHYPELAVFNRAMMLSFNQQVILNAYNFVDLHHHPYPINGDHPNIFHLFRQLPKLKICAHFIRNHQHSHIKLSCS